MSTSIDNVRPITATHVSMTDEALVVQLDDGRTLSVPLAWYPRLEHASNAERGAWKLIGSGTGIHWESIDEDISVEALIAGKRSNESRSSLRRWLSTRNV